MEHATSAIDTCHKTFRTLSMDGKVLFFLAVAAATGFLSVNGKPMQIVPVEPGVQPAKVSELMVSKYFLLPPKARTFHFVMNYTIHQKL